MLSLQEGGGDVAQREVVAMEEAFETVGGRGVGLGGALSVVMMVIMVLMILLTNALSRRFQKGGNRR